MKSYKIYLTRSSEVAARIAKTFMPGDDIEKTEHGMVNEDNAYVPTIYHGKGYFYCIVTLKEHETEAPTFELTIC